jgi:quercetin dioxygenase-like cupin family protein
VRVQRLAYASEGDVARLLDSLSRKGPSVLQIGTAQFPAGLRSPVDGFHTRDADEIALVLEGRFEAVVSGEVRILNAGDFVVIPAGEPNAARALEPAKVLWMMYAPEGTPPP